MSDSNPSEKQSDYEKFRKLELNSNEIDKNTGRIILPSSGVIETIREKSAGTVAHQAPTPTQKKASPTLPSVEQPPQAQPNMMAEPLPSKPSEDPPVRTPERIKEKSPSFPVLNFFRLVMSMLILGALIWLGLEVRQLGSTMAQLDLTVPPPQVIYPQQESPLNQDDIDQLMQTAEEMHEEFPQVLSSLSESIDELNRELKSLEFEIIEPEQEILDPVIETLAEE